MPTKRPNAIPFAEAARLWRQYGFASPGELVLEDLALALGVLVIDEKLDSCEGRLVRDGERGIIRVRRGLTPNGRRRFVVAHELGHWMLHKSQSQLSICTGSDMIATYAKSRLEAEANSFASALLMPENLFQTRRHPGAPTFQHLGELSRFFDTSLTATAMRWVDLATDYCALVMSSRGKIAWWRGSANFEDAMWIHSGSQLSKRAAASEVSSAAPESGQVEVDIDAWAEVREELTTTVLWEESIWLRGYDIVMTLLWLP